SRRTKAASRRTLARRLLLRGRVSGREIVISFNDRASLYDGSMNGGMPEGQVTAVLEAAPERLLDPQGLIDGSPAGGPGAGSLPRRRLSSEQNAQASGGRSGDGIEVVASFEGQDDPSFRKIREPPSQRSVPCRRDAHLPEQIPERGVEAARDENQVRLELTGDREKQLVEAREVIGISHPGRPGQVDRETARIRAADLEDVTGAWIERPLVGRKVEHFRIVPEGVLCSVAVMQVPVDDQSARAPITLGRLRGDRDIVEEAKSHRV